MKDLSAKLRLSKKTEEYGPIRGEIEINLKQKETTSPKLTIDLKEVNGPVWILSISGGLKGYHYGESWGQIYEEMEKFFNDNPLVEKIIPIWERYHLNDINAGTRLQRDWIDRYKKNHPDWRYDYDEACRLLKENYVDEDRGYKYGHEWLIEIIPDDVLEEIKDIIQTINK